MGLKAQIKRRVARHLLSLSRRDALRERFERNRVKNALPHQVSYFHDVSDPYSHLIAQVLQQFVARYDIALDVNLVPPPPDWAAPDRTRLEAFSRLDAERLARRAGLDFRDPGKQPSKAQMKAAQSAMLAAINEDGFLEQVNEISSLLWSGDGPQGGQPEVDDALLNVAIESGAEKRENLGHYLGATLHYGGEWYWGPDRLHYLETRLQELGAARDPAKADLIYAPQDLQLLPVKKPKKKELHWYLSFRSPYSSISADRVKKLADHYGAELKIRYVLPMVMRGMSVPRAKRMYIVKDVVREAERIGVPFGDIVDPLGLAVERGYAVLQYAIEENAGFEFTHSFLKGAWADGIDATTDKGLRRISERAGLNWPDAKKNLQNPKWREIAEQNRSEMTAHGVWGVPGFRVDQFITWGQDRLWLVEEYLRS